MVRQIRKRILFCLLLMMIAGFGFSQELVQAETRQQFNYAVAISAGTSEDAKWVEVANVLLAKYANSDVFVYHNLKDLTDELIKFSPDYIAFVCKPEETTPDFVKQASELNRSLENKPYGMAVWGIVTGYNPDDALRIANESQPLQINFGLGGMLNFIDALPTGVAYCEFYDKRYEWQEKTRASGLVNRNDAPDDHLLPMIDLLNSNTVNGVWTSGHGLPDSWLTYYPDGPAQIVALNGNLLGEINGETKAYIESSNPKIYLGVGNCLTACIDNVEKAYSLAWIHSGGVNQYFGYTVPTYYGLMGWGMADNFFYRGADFNVAESMFAANQALLLALDQNLAPEEVNDLEYDRDVCVVYGDPAWMAKVPLETAKNVEQWQCRLDRNVQGNKIQWELTVDFKRDSDFSPESGSKIRPVFAFMPERISGAVAQSDLTGISAYHIASNFIIINFQGIVKAGETRKFSFTSDISK